MTPQPLPIAHSFHPHFPVCVVCACVHADMYLFQYLVCLCLLFLHSFFLLASCLPWSCNPKHRIVSLDCWYSTFRICFAHRNHPFLKTIILQCHLRYSLPHSLSASPLHPFQSLQSQAPCPNLIWFPVPVTQSHQTKALQQRNGKKRTRFWMSWCLTSPEMKLTTWTLRWWRRNSS